MIVYKRSFDTGGFLVKMLFLKNALCKTISLTADIIEGQISPQVH